MTSFPVTESTLSADHLAQWLRKQYGLGEATSCRLFRTGMNHLYLVRDGEQRYVLRIYTHGWRTKPEVEEELRLLLHLKTAGISVAYPITAANGGLVHDLHAPEGLRFAVLFSFAEGKKAARFSTQISYRIGVVMARMHRATENFVLQRVQYDVPALLARPLEKIRAFFTAPSEEVAFMERLAEYLAGQYPQLDAGEVRRGAIHLDIWFDNMHFDGEEVYVFDFDFCGNGWLCMDCAYFLYQLFSTHPDEHEYREKAAAFLEGYESIVKLTADEKRMLPVASLYVMVFYLGIQCDRFDTWSNIFLNEDHLKRYTGAIKRWIAFQGIPVQ